MRSNFTFLAAEWPALHEAAAKAEASAHSDPRTACFYARRALEIAVAWVYKFDATLHLPYQDNLSSLIHEPSFKSLAGDAVFTKARLVTQLGNQAVHSHRPIAFTDAQTAVRELFHIGYWIARSYARTTRPAAGVTFDVTVLTQSPPLPQRTLDQLQKLEADLRARDEKLAAVLDDKLALDEELKKLREEIALAKKAAAALPADTHDYSEAVTRDTFIDVLLDEAGWTLGTARTHEVEVHGMPNPQGVGYVDYVLWGDDGKPLAVVEAKRTRKSADVGRQQAKLYADCLEKQYGQRPLIFYTNGYEHFLWDDLAYPPRAVQGFYKKPELELLIQRRTSRKSLGSEAVDTAIVERYYQTRAIRRIAEAFEKDRERKALVVMATGAGKTRTVIALCDLLMKCNHAKRVLFLADRVALVNQAVGAFKTHLPDASPVNLVTDKDTEGRVYLSTYPTMMGLIDDTADGLRRFGVGHFDLVVIDEAHRSVYQKYKAIFAYFDALLVGLTATPKDEIDFDTYKLFDLERGVPTDQYDLADAVKDGYLVPSQAVSVPLKFPRAGIAYKSLSEEEKGRWDEIEWDENGPAPDRVEADAVNKWLFNGDTVDKALAHLMTRGQKVAGGDRLGKTIVFAKNQEHAKFIAERFDHHYPHLAGSFARVIHCGLAYAQTLIDAFTEPTKPPHIAISVDMLDTGIDVPEVANLVFFKPVRSKTKFWQMVGRGTRLCPDLFGPGQDKVFFYIFDYCENLEFFGADPETSEGSLGESLSKRLFTARVDLLGELDRPTELPPGAATGAADVGLGYGDVATKPAVRARVANILHTEVAAMNFDNFVVRPKRLLVERYAKPEAWIELTDDARAELAHEIAGLPSELPSEDEEAKRFDLVMLRLQLARLRHDGGFVRLRDQVREIAALLEEKSTIPMVREQLSFIHDLQTDAWWQDVTVPMLENARRRLRELVKFIEKARRKPVYTDFEDQLGAETLVELPGFAPQGDYERFKAKAQMFLRVHADHLAVRKLRMNIPLTPSDLKELEQILSESGVGAAGNLAKACTESQGLGLFVRSLVGLDREAAKHAFAGFLSGKTLTANQIEFVNMMIEHLTHHGVMGADLLYASPFTDVATRGPDEIFTHAQIDELVAVLDKVRSSAIAA